MRHVFIEKLSNVTLTATLLVDISKEIFGSIPKHRVMVLILRGPESCGGSSIHHVSDGTFRQRQYQFDSDRAQFVMRYSNTYGEGFCG